MKVHTIIIIGSERIKVWTNDPTLGTTKNLWEPLRTTKKLRKPLGTPWKINDQRNYLPGTVNHQGPHYNHAQSLYAHNILDSVQRM